MWKDVDWQVAFAPASMTRSNRQEEKEKKQRSKLLVKGTCSGKQNCSDRAGQEVTWEFAGREEQESLGGREKAATEKKE